MKFGRAIPTPIRIMPTDSHGFIVDIGFATFACEGPERVLSILQDYLAHPTTFVDELKATRKGSDECSAKQSIPSGSIVMPSCEGAKIGNPTR